MLQFVRVIFMSDRITFFNDISYGSHERQVVDLLIPEKTESDRGIILFIHGGGWHSGDKSAHSDDALHFCKLGYISATMNYRFVSEAVSVFDELDDITAALTCLKNKCAEKGIEINKVLLSGASAGAHLALMYAYTRKNQAPVAPVAVCAYSSPLNCAGPDFLNGISDEFDDWKYDLLSKCSGFKITKSDAMNEKQQDVLGRISPEKYVTADCVPTAVFHGRYDDLCPVEYSYAFLELLKANGVENDFLLYENSGHTLDKDPDTALRSKEIMRIYAEKYLR